MAFHYDFRKLKSRDDLIKVLGVSDSLFDAVIAFDPPSTTAGNAQAESDADGGELDFPLFIRHEIPKRNPARGCRTVWEPLFRSDYKALARRLTSFFELGLPGFPHPCACGFSAGRNIRENALPHVGKRFLLSTDIRDFFPSISVTRIAELFECMGVTSTVAIPLAKFVTIQGALPLGLPTSPIISNAIALPIDDAMRALSKEADAVYTRYADDMSFSSDKGLPELDAVRSILKQHGFELAEAKTRRSKLGQAHYVTGLSVSDPVRPHVPREMKRRLRQELYYARKFGVSEHFHRRGIRGDLTVQNEFNRLDGLVRFVSHHEPTLAASLRWNWSEIAKANKMRRSFAPKNQGRAPFYIFVDETEFVKGNRRCLALGFCVSQHGPHIAAESAEVLDEALGDLWADGKREALEKKGLHFADATQDLRLAYIKRLATMRLEAYVAFSEISGGDDYQAKYLQLLSALISRRLMAAESQMAFFFFEKNDKVSQSAIKACIEAAYLELAKRNDRRPRRMGLEFISKPDFRISPPDFLLGVLGLYLQSKDPGEGKPEPRERLMFERLRDKFRVILDVSNGIEYSRRRPIHPWLEDALNAKTAACVSREESDLPS